MLGRGVNELALPLSLKSCVISTDLSSCPARTPKLLLETSKSARRSTSLYCSLHGRSSFYWWPTGKWEGIWILFSLTNWSLVMHKRESPNFFSKLWLLCKVRLPSGWVRGPMLGLLHEDWSWPRVVRRDRGLTRQSRWDTLGVSPSIAVKESLESWSSWWTRAYCECNLWSLLVTSASWRDFKLDWSIFLAFIAVKLVKLDYFSLRSSTDNLVLFSFNLKSVDNWLARWSSC